MIDYDGYTDYRNYTKDRVQPYSDSELKALWLGFAGDPDEAEKLADFAQCSREEATEMIADYKTTAAAKRAAQAEEKRRKDKDTSKRKKFGEWTMTAALAGAAQTIAAIFLTKSRYGWSDVPEVQLKEPEVTDDETPDAIAARYEDLPD